MIKQFSLSIILFISPFLFAQYSPEYFQINGEAGQFSKISDDTPISNSISDIITIGDTVYLGTSRGISISTDKGETWKNFYNSEAFGTESISAIGYYNGVFWAATAHSIEKDGQSLPEGSGLRYSTDAGNTWTTIAQPIDDDNDTIVTYGNNQLRALPVTVRVQNLIYDIAFTPNTLWVATFAGGLRKSTNMGQTWERVVLPPDTRNSVHPTDTLNFCIQPVAGRFCSENNLNYRVFSVIATNDSTLYVGTAGGINKSTDNGISWVKFTHQNQENPISGNFIVALAYNNNNNSLWAATWRAEGQTEFYGVSTSSDAGANWDVYLDEEKVHNFGFIRNDVLALSDNGPFRSQGSSPSWILPGTITDPITGITLSTKVYYAAASQGNTLWLGSGDGLVRLRETSGIAWQGEWKIYFASPQLTSGSNTYCYPNPFSPKTDLLKIKYSTGGTSKNVTIRIYDFSMNYVRTIIQSAPRNPQHVVDNPTLENSGVIDNWDGRDDNGNIVSNGVYIYRVEFSSGDPVFGKIIVLQ